MSTDHTLTEAVASRFARAALGHVTREYPNAIQHTLSGPGDARTPRELHPIFFGSLDWHSCVHGYWLLVTLLRLYPELPEAQQIRELLASRITDESVRGEVAYFEAPLRRTFERPYGWAWLLMLAAELRRSAGNYEKPCAVTIAPLSDLIAARFLEFLPKATYPVRVGTHYNSAFALALALEYADVAVDANLRESITSKARSWYGDDAACQGWEPGGDDFLSPALIEAECMRRVMRPEEFSGWMERFLPQIEQSLPATLFLPATVSDRTDGKIAHLDGLNLSRAWCWRLIARSYSDDDSRARIALAAADAHLNASLPHVTGDYMGEHWLATFALLAIRD